MGAASPIDPWFRGEARSPVSLDAWADRGLDLRFSYFAASRAVIDDFTGSLDAGTLGPVAYTGYTAAVACSGTCSDNFVHDASGARLAWDTAAATASFSASGLDASSYRAISVRFASRAATINAGIEEHDFSIRVTDGRGTSASVPVSEVGRVPAVYPAFRPLEVLGTVRVPFARLRAVSPTLDLSALARVEVVMGAPTIADVEVTGGERARRATRPWRSRAPARACMHQRTFLAALAAMPIVALAPAESRASLGIGPTEPRSYVTTPPPPLGERLELSDAEWRQRLTRAQYDILRHERTEPSFSCELWEEHREGRFYCGGCCAPLFSSEHKFESGTGWASFYRPVEPGRVTERSDVGFGMVRTEVRCARCDGHLGLFPDGPPPPAPLLHQRVTPSSPAEGSPLKPPVPAAMGHVSRAWVGSITLGSLFSRWGHLFSIVPFLGPVSPSWRRSWRSSASSSRRLEAEGGRGRPGDRRITNIIAFFRDAGVAIVGPAGRRGPTRTTQVRPAVFPIRHAGGPHRCLCLTSAFRRPCGDAHPPVIAPPSAPGRPATVLGVAPPSAPPTTAPPTRLVTASAHHGATRTPWRPARWPSTPPPLPPGPHPPLEPGRKRSDRGAILVKFTLRRHRPTSYGPRSPSAS
jgi:peptide-methionine (R)-S-oxide reductase